MNASTINITVHLHTILQRQTPQGMISRMDVDLPSGSTLADLLQRLEIDLAPDHLLLAVNGRVADLERVLEDNDTINLMPAISGGNN